MSELILTEANFEAEVLKSEKPVLVDFYADWCGPCKMQGPIIAELAAEVGQTAKVGKLNIDLNSAIAEKYGVMSIPTLIIFQGGAAKKTMVGLQGKDGLKAELARLAS